MRSRKARKKAYRCQECGAEAVKWEGRCAVCGKWGTMQEATAGTGDEKAVSLPPGVQAVLERLVAGVRVDRKRAAGTLRYLTEKPPHGLWLSVDRLEILVHDVLVRHEQDPLDNPLGYMVVLARGPEKKTVHGSINRPEVEESWKPVASTGMASLKDVIDKLSLPESSAVEAGKASPAPAPGDGGSSAAVPSDDGCGGCDDAGFVLPRRLDAPSSRPPEPEVCPKCGGETAEGKAERLLTSSRLSGLQLEMTLDRLEEVEGLGAALAAVKAFLSGEVDQLVLIGGTGRGKSHLAIGVLLACMKRGELCLYLNVARFLDELRMSFENNARDRFSDLMRPALEREVVVLDDLAGQKATDWATEKLYEIVDGRYGKGLKTIACSNHPMKTWDPRIVSRLSDNRRSRVVVLETKDYRLVPRPAGVA